MGTSEDGYEPLRGVFELLQEPAALTTADGQKWCPDELAKQAAQMIAELRDEQSTLRQEFDTYRKNNEEVAFKLIEQQQINGQLRQSLADTTSYVLTLCRVIQRTLG